MAEDFFFHFQFTIKGVMTKKTGCPVTCFFLCALLLSVCLASSGRPSENGHQSTESPLYWELRIDLRLKGNYEAKEGEETYTGHYVYDAEWIGCMEEDQADFLLYYEDHKLVKWDAQEKAKGPEGTQIMETENFSEPPQIDFHYVLIKEEAVHFNFKVSGFEIPQSPSKFKHRLLLPATEENTEVMMDNFYSRDIEKGTNRVLLPIGSFYGERVTASFSWDWEDSRWTRKADTVVFFGQSHDVEVEVTVVPHYRKQSSENF